MESTNEFLEPSEREALLYEIECYKTQLNRDWWRAYALGISTGISAVVVIAAVIIAFIK